MIEGIRYPHPESQYPHFTPWSEVQHIGVFEVTDVNKYGLYLERKHGDDLAIIKSRDLATVEAAFEDIMDQIAAGRTVIEVSV